ncbi:MAG: S24/S26 family peptidase [Actinomycetota bacterium]
MQPSIVSGDQVRIVAAGRPRRGEVWAAVQNDGDVVVHRFLRRRGDLYVFRGDARRRFDPALEPGRLVGRVDLVEGAKGTRVLGTAARNYWWLRAGAAAGKRSLKAAALGVARRRRSDAAGR